MQLCRFTALGLILVLVAPSVFGASAAEDPPPWPEFTFKRVGPPPADDRPRINVRIRSTPEAPAAPVTGASPETLPDSPSLPNEAFWAQISPAISAASPGRLDAALAALDEAPPRLDDLRRITDRFGRDILLATVGTRVSPAFVAALIAVESAGRPDAQSGAGAQGLMQLMPETAQRFDVADPFDPVQNISGGVAYLDWLMGAFDSDPVLVLAGYNAGEGALHEHGGVPPFPETRAYVPRVLAAWQVASALCLTRPDLISDGCVFLGPDSR